MENSSAEKVKEETMYYIGIDISKFKHDCAVIDDVGDFVTPSWSFANNREGFLQFKALLDSFGSETRIGLVLYRHQITGCHFTINRICFGLSKRFTLNETID